MKHSIALLLFLCAACRAGLDLTPRFSFRKDGGYVARRACFSDGVKKYAIPLKDDMDVVPHEGGALIRFKNVTASAMRLRGSPLDAGLPFTPETLAKYEEAALALLPPGREEVAVVSRAAEPLPINGWTGWRITFSYRNPGGMNSESITFLNVSPAQQIVIQTGSRPGDFEQVQGRADAIMRRWFEMPPEGESDVN